jgi:hypothetical protein
MMTLIYATRYAHFFNLQLRFTPNPRVSVGMLSSTLTRFITRLSLLCLLGNFFSIAPLQADTEAPSAAQLQAVFLFRFSLFIEWPDYAFASTDNPFNICVFGEHEFGDMLDLVIADEFYKEQHPIHALYLSKLEQIPQCHILFITTPEAYRIEGIIRRASVWPILTVSDVRGFVRTGGMIEFYTRSKRIRFMIDPIMAREQDLVINANLLRIADIVE